MSVRAFVTHLPPTYHPAVHSRRERGVARRGDDAVRGGRFPRRAAGLPVPRGNRALGRPNQARDFALDVSIYSGLRCTSLSFVEKKNGNRTLSTRLASRWTRNRIRDRTSPGSPRRVLTQGRHRRRLRSTAASRRPRSAAFHVKGRLDSSTESPHPPKGAGPARSAGSPPEATRWPTPLCAPSNRPIL